MTNILCFNIASISENDFYLFLPLLPNFMRSEVMRYFRTEDRRARLVARLLLLHCLQVEGHPELIYRWQRDENGKPWIDGWCPFCIAHSGDVVLFSWSDGVNGIDIERKRFYDIDNLLYLFHPIERKLLLETKGATGVFCDLWAKKESLLKAIGTGITEGLSQYDCSGDFVEENSHSWYFHNVSIDSEYSSFLCTSHKEEFIQITRLSRCRFLELARLSHLAKHSGLDIGGIFQK